jgi:hypothetical protein
MTASKSATCTVTKPCRCGSEGQLPQARRRQQREGRQAGRGEARTGVCPRPIHCLQSSIGAYGDETWGIHHSVWRVQPAHPRP